MKPQGNGIVTMVDDKQSERGFNCMKLIKFMWNDDRYNNWDSWHSAHIEASRGNCPFRMKCEAYKKSMKAHPSKQLNLFV